MWIQTSLTFFGGIVSDGLSPGSAWDGVFLYQPNKKVIEGSFFLTGTRRLGPSVQSANVFFDNSDAPGFDLSTGETQVEGFVSVYVCSNDPRVDEALDTIDELFYGAAFGGSTNDDICTGLREKKCSKTDGCEWQACGSGDQSDAPCGACVLNTPLLASTIDVAEDPMKTNAANLAGLEVSTLLGGLFLLLALWA